jgi:hypothetical protein
MSKLKPMSFSDTLKKQDLDHISLLNQARKLRALNRRLSQTLPSPLRDNVGIANINNGNLSLYAHTPAWCYKLRLHSRPIVKFLKDQGISIKNVSYSVVPLDTITDIGSTRSLPKREVHQQTLDDIREKANKIKDKELKEVLLSFVEKFGATSNG